MNGQQKEYLKLQRELKTKQQEQIINRYEDLLWLIVYGLGGICFTTHIHQLMGGHKTQNRRILAKMEEIDLLDTIRLGNNTIIKVKAPVIRHFTGETKVTTVSRRTVLQSALLCEIYLKAFGDLGTIRKRLSHTNLIHFSPEHNIRLISGIRKKYIEFKKDVSGIETQLQILSERREFEKRKKTKGERLEFSIENAEKHLASQSDDLYTLVCKNIFIRYRGEAATDLSTGRKMITFDVIFLNLSQYKPKDLARLIRDTYTTLSSIFNGDEYYLMKICNLDYKYSQKEIESIDGYLDESKLDRNYFKVDYECFEVKQKLLSNKTISQLL